MSRGYESALLTGWQTIFAANLATSIPGGLWLNRVPQAGTDGAALKTPYAEVAIKPGPAQYSSGDTLQVFHLDMTVWSAAGAVDAGSIQGAIGRAYDPPSGTGAPPALSVAGAKVVRVDAVDGRFELDAARIKAGDVLLAQASWDVLLQVPR